MAFIISSLLVLSVWVWGMFQLRGMSLKTSVPYETLSEYSKDTTEDISSLKVPEIFDLCRKVFENTPDFKLFCNFCKDEIQLSEEQKETLKKEMYFSFVKFRPCLSGFNGKLNETEFFCYILMLMGVDNRHCGEFLNISESSVRSCKSRLKGKLEYESLELLNDMKNNIIH